MKHILLFLILTCSIRQYGQTYYKHSCGFAFHSCILSKMYTPRDIKSLEQLPDTVKSKLEIYLKNYLTEPFYNRIKLVEGREIDVTKMEIACPEIKNYQWKVPRYDLMFAFSDSAHQIGQYSFCIELNPKGDIVDLQDKKIDKIDITRFSNADTVLFISPATAKKIAKKYNNKKKAIILLSFHKQRIAWTFRTGQRDEKNIYFIQEVYIDAHNGQLLGIDKTYGIIDFY